MPSEIHTKADALIKAAQAKGLTLATAESCTGGWIGKALTEIPGSSAVFLGGLITYSNQSKLELLGIPPEILDFYGAVSEPVAGAMALQTRDMLRADIAVSVTGIAGPGGGSEEKPVGMVCFGLIRRGQKPTTATQIFGDLGREQVRERTVLTALDLMQTCVDQL
ncbi:MAG: damage-inducible protein CinA [Robiginitomaculum sp.]|nr:MAG: damage-inducible protein CinA [Robiginitomaculum sp.]